MAMPETAVADGHQSPHAHVVVKRILLPCQVMFLGPKKAPEAISELQTL